MCGTHADLLQCFSEDESFINLRGAEHRFSAAGHSAFTTQTLRCQDVIYNVKHQSILTVIHY